MAKELKMLLDAIPFAPYPSSSGGATWPEGGGRGGMADAAARRRKRKTPMAMQVALAGWWFCGRHGRAAGSASAGWESGVT